MNEELRNKLKSNNFQNYLNSLQEIRAALRKDKDLEISQEDFEHICKIYYHYKTGPYDDFGKMQKKIMDLLVKHREFLTANGAKYAIPGLSKYTYGLMQGMYDPSGFSFVSGSLEICTSVDAKKIAETLKEHFPDDASQFEEYRELMRNIEGGYHQAYHIIRFVGNKHIEKLEPVLFSVEPVFKSFILHAMDAFVGDEGIINLYKKYIKFFEDLMANTDKEEVKKECEYLIKEAQDYLSTVE